MNGYEHEDSVERSVPHSSHWGSFDVVVRAGTVVGTEPRDSGGSSSQIIHGIAGAVNGEVRVRHPAVREGWLHWLESGRPEEGSGRRGADRYVTVPWDDALDLVAAELARVRAEYGNQAIFGGSYGWSSAGRFHHAKTLLTRMLNCLGGFTSQVSNYSFAAADAILPHVIGTARPAGGAVTTWDVLAQETQLWIAFGGLPAKNTAVEGGGTWRHRFEGNLRRVADSGTRFVLVSPSRGDMPSAIDAEWIPIRPGTDTALMLALAHELVTTGQSDEDFLRTHCVGWPQVRSYLCGHDDGQPKSPRWAARICGIDEQVIRELASALATHRTMLSATWSLQRAENGEHVYWMLVTLAAVLGQIGLPGGGFGFAYGCEDGIGSSRYPYPAPAMPAGTNRTDSRIPVARIADMLLYPGREYEFAGTTMRYPDTKLIYWAGGNPFHHHQDLNRLNEAWQRPQTIVVNEIWWTSTARRADIVLPATSTLERNDLSASSRDPYIVAMKQAVTPLHGSRNDYDIFAGIAARLGVADGFTEGRDEDAWLRQIYETFRARARDSGHHLPDFDEFWELGRVRVWPEESMTLLDAFRADPVSAPLATPSGRIELFSDTIARFGYAEVPGHATWLEPQEWLGSDLAVRYPLHLLSTQPATRLHSQLDMASASADSKVGGREPCRISRVDADARGIVDGSIIRLHNDRGACLAGAVIDESLMPGVVVLSTGAWFSPKDPEQTGSLELHGNPNVLTADRATSRLGQAPTAQSTLVEASLWVEPEPAPDVHTVTPVADDGRSGGQGRAAGRGQDLCT